MMDAAWSRDGKQVALWSGQNNKVLYVMNADGTGLVEHKLGDTQILGAPQFWPDGSSVVFYGADRNDTGLFEFIFNASQASMIDPFVEDASGYAFSPNGSALAYMKYDHDVGEASLMTLDLISRELAWLGTFSIPKGSGSSVPTTANMSWSEDGTSIVFDVGRGANDRVIYLARVDGTELLQVVDAGYAPAISSDGKCLAYMNNKQLFLLDLTASSKSVTTTPFLLADLPAGKGVTNYQLDKLQWRP
jgi:Tol biopolymer transport system component